MLLTPSIAKSVTVQNEEITNQAPKFDNHIQNLAKVIFMVETGGKLDCSITGLSGEKGCFQFVQSTWEAYSIDAFGYIAEINQENENIVVEHKIKGWKDKGYSDSQIFLIWNQGNIGQCSAGINKFGVAYDSCAYVEKSLTLLKTLENGQNLTK